MKTYPLFVEILLKEGLDEHWREWFGGLALTRAPSGSTRLSGQVPDRAALHGVLERIRDLNLQIVSVQVQDGPLNAEGEPSS